MPTIGCDYHRGFQQIALVNTETGELYERRLSHREEAEKFYHGLASRGADCVWAWKPTAYVSWMPSSRRIIQVAEALC